MSTEASEKLTAAGVDSPVMRQYARAGTRREDIAVVM